MGITLSALLHLLIAAGSARAGPSSTPFLEALVSPTGVVTVSDNGAVVAVIEPGLYLAGWSRKSAAGARHGGTKNLGGFLDLGESGKVVFEASATRTGEAVELHYTIIPTATLLVETVHASILLPVADWVGATTSSGSITAVVPDNFGKVVLLSGSTQRFILGPSPVRPGTTIEVSLPRPGNITLQDSRQWGPELEVRLADRPGDRAWTWNAGEPRRFDLVVSFGRRVRISYDTPATIKAGRDWVPVSGSLDIIPFSAVDFGGIIPRFPAGVAGWLKRGRGRPDTFEFEKRTGIPARFYGANLCYSAQFLPNNEAERLAERLMHIGYNSVRIHHY
jgi:hypothetical protein